MNEWREGGRKEGREGGLTLINVRMNWFFILVTYRVCFKIIQEERVRGQQSIYEEYKLKQAQLWVSNYWNCQGGYLGSYYTMSSPWTYFKTYIMKNLTKHFNTLCEAKVVVAPAVFPLLWTCKHNFYKDKIVKAPVYWSYNGKPNLCQPWKVQQVSPGFLLHLQGCTKPN